MVRTVCNMALALYVVACSTQPPPFSGGVDHPVSAPCTVTPPVGKESKETKDQAAKLNVTIASVPLGASADVEQKAEKQVKETYQVIPDKQAACAMLFQTIQCLETRNPGSALAQKLADNVRNLCAEASASPTPPIDDNVTGSFIEPHAHTTVDRTIRCSGIVSGMQRGLSLWLAVEVNGLVWPKESRVLPDADNKWSTTIFEDGVPDKFSVSLFVVNAAADERIKTWLEDGRHTGRYSELRGIPGARRLARVDGLTLK